MQFILVEHLDSKSHYLHKYVINTFNNIMPRTKSQITMNIQQKQPNTAAQNFKVKAKKKSSWSVCDNRNQQKNSISISNTKNKRSHTQNDKIIHSMFPKIRLENPGFIQTLKLLRKRRHSHLILLENQESQGLKQLMPTASKISKVKQCQLQVRKYLKQLTKTRPNPQISPHFHSHSNPKCPSASSHSTLMIKSSQYNFSVLPSIQQSNCLGKKYSLTKSGCYEDNGKYYERNFVYRTQRNQRVTTQFMLEDQTLVCRRAPFNTLRNTKNVKEIKDRDGEKDGVDMDGREILEFTKKLGKGKLKKLYPSTKFKSNLNNNFQTGISPWQSYHHGFMDAA